MKKKIEKRLTRIAAELTPRINARQIPLTLPGHEVWVWANWEGLDSTPTGDEVYVDFSGPRITIPWGSSGEDEGVDDYSLDLDIDMDGLDAYLVALAEVGSAPRFLMADPEVVLDA